MFLIFLQNWTREIVVLLVMALVIDMALPSTSLRRYVDFSLSLVLLFLLLSPILKLLASPPELITSSGAAHTPSVAYTEMSERSAWLAYKLVLEERVVDVAKSVREVVSCKAEVTLDQNPASRDYGTVTHLGIRLRVDPGLDLAKRQAVVGSIKSEIHLTLGLKPESISINIEW